jgi:hypothetical protein
MVHIYLIIHNLGIVPGENLTLPTKEQDYCSLWHSTDSLQNDKRHDWYTSPNVIRVKNFDKIETVGVCGTCGERDRRGMYRVLVGKFEGKRPLGRSRLRWDDNITTDLK